MHATTGTAPPARPHSAHPYMTLPNTLFRTTSSNAPASRPHSAAQRTQRPSLSQTHSHDLEWEDPWDSSSDREDDSPTASATSPTFSRPSTSTLHHATTSAKTAPIPIVSRAREQQSPPASGSISTSWVSASFHPTPVQSTPPPVIAASATAASGSGLASESGSSSGAVAPVGGGGGAGTSRRVPSNVNPSTSTTRQDQGGAPTRLPPGGAWEIVEPADATEPSPSTPTPHAGAEAVRTDAEDILRDPMHLLASLVPISTPNSPALAAAGFDIRSSGSGRNSPLGQGHGVTRQRSVRSERRRERFAKVLSAGDRAVDVAELRKLAWSGVPAEVRPIVWQLLLNYLPLASQPRLAILQRKRKEYAQLVEQYFGRGPAYLDQQIWHQIEIDVPRTRPGTPLWACDATQRSLERILYVWAIRHPASGYVQGINDLATPFFEVFLSAYISPNVDAETFNASTLPPHLLAAVEADSFWCLTKLLDGIQDHYIKDQPGIQRLVKRMGELVKRIDPPLAAHFDDQGVEYMQFAFRWMNCLLMREISVRCTVRMWDTYLSEGTDAFSSFHLYVCSALLVKFSDRLREMDFQEMIMFLQRLPTTSWTDHDIELLLSEAFVLKTVWQDAESHFANVPKSNGWGMMGR